MRMAVLVLMVMANPCFAAQATTVHVSVGKVSEVSFPENIAKVIKGGSVDSILVEAIDNALYILPKSETPSDIFVTGVSGKSYPLNLKSSSEHDLNVFVDNTSVISKSYQSRINAMDLMRELLQGYEPAGSTRIEMRRTLILKEAPIALEFSLAYDFSILRVYIITAHNLSHSTVIVPIEQIAFNGILAIASKVDTLSPSGYQGDRTIIYMIVKK